MRGDAELGYETSLLHVRPLSSLVASLAEPEMTAKKTLVCFVDRIVGEMAIFRQLTQSHSGHNCANHVKVLELLVYANPIRCGSVGTVGMGSGHCQLSVLK